MASDIALTAAQRTSLLSLKSTQTLSNRTQLRLSTGRRINSVGDDAVNYFRSKALTDRASDFEIRKNGIDQGISALNAFLAEVTAIDSYLKQMKGIITATKSQSVLQRKAATTQIQELGKQIFQLVEDVNYQGLNLLNATTAELDVSFGVRTASRLLVKGLDLNGATTNVEFTDAYLRGIFSVNTFSSGGKTFNLTSFGLSNGSFTSLGKAHTNNVQADKMSLVFDKAINRLRGHAASLGSNVAILKTRLKFTNTYVSELTIGSDKLTLADLNEEGAALVALQTRQQLGIQALAISGQQQQAILTLLQ